MSSAISKKKQLNSAHSTSKHPKLQTILDDLICRFIINCPREDRETPERFGFQLELAHWFYLDNYLPLVPDLPRLITLDNFVSTLYKHCPLLGTDSASILGTFHAYSKKVPTCGAILLTPNMEKCLLVKGYHKGSSWGFPKGKINKEESEINCAVREVFEEIGYDISGKISENDFVEAVVNERKIKLYIVPDVMEDTVFAPQTKQEIEKIKWHQVSSLPKNRKQVEKGNDTTEKYWVSPFISQLQKWIEQKQQYQNLPQNGEIRTTANGIIGRNDNASKKYGTNNVHKDLRDFSPVSCDYSGFIAQTTIQQKPYTMEQETTPSPMISTLSPVNSPGNKILEIPKRKLTKESRVTKPTVATTDSITSPISNTPEKKTVTIPPIQNTPPVSFFYKKSSTKQNATTTPPSMITTQMSTASPITILTTSPITAPMVIPTTSPITTPTTSTSLNSITKQNTTTSPIVDTTQLSQLFNNLSQISTKSPISNTTSHLSLLVNNVSQIPNTSPIPPTSPFLSNFTQFSTVTTPIKSTTATILSTTPNVTTEIHDGSNSNNGENLTQQKIQSLFASSQYIPSPFSGISAQFPSAQGPYVPGTVPLMNNLPGNVPPNFNGMLPNQAPLPWRFN